MTNEMIVDENGVNARYQDWCDICGTNDTASDGSRVCAAKALEIAADILHFFNDPIGKGRSNNWTQRDIKLALGAIAGIRAQAGIHGPDSRYLHRPEGLMATEQIDIWVYG